MRILSTYRLGILEGELQFAKRGRLIIPVEELSGAEHSTINGMVSIVEHFAVRLTIDKLRDTLPSGPRVLADAISDINRRVEARWSDRLSAWRNWFGLDLSTDPDFAQLLGFVEARNAILHGRGALTRQQLASDAGRAVIGKLATAGIQVTLGRLQIGQAAVELCARASKKSILVLDERLGSAQLL
jgi:hypothetical protein